MHFIVFLLLALTFNVNAYVRKNCVRREFRTLSLSERDRYVAAVRQLNEGPRPTVMDKLVYKHVKYFHFLHTPENTTNSQHVFLPWHRKFLLDYEKELQKIDSSLCASYWAWSEDYHEGSSSILLSNRYFGGDGNNETSCLRDGQFKNWQALYDVDLVIEKRCVKREFTERGDLKIERSDVLYGVLGGSNDFYSLTFDLEEFHNRFHDGFGGIMLTHASPYDPVFWLHHAYIDKIWMDWQTKNLKRATDYSGNRNELLKGYSEKVGDYIDYRKMNYCYEDYKSDARILRDELVKYLKKYNKTIEIPFEYRSLEPLRTVSGFENLVIPKADIVGAKIKELIENFNNEPTYIPPHAFQLHPQLSKLLKWYQNEKMRGVSFELFFQVILKP